MKRRIETLTLLLIMTFMLLAGCSGCGQKTAPETPVTPPNRSTPDNTPQLSGVQQNKTPLKPRGKTAKLSAEQFKDFEYLATLKGIEYIEISREDEVGIPTPWDPIVVPLERWKKYAETLDELRIAARQKTITDKEYEAKLLQNLREYGLVAYAQLSIEVRGSVGYRVTNLINLAYAENPDDFDTLLMWVYAGGNLGDLYGEEKTVATRRLW